MAYEVTIRRYAQPPLGTRRWIVEWRAEEGTVRNIYHDDLGVALALAHRLLLEEERKERDDTRQST